MAIFGRFIKLPILLIASIVYLIIAISLCPIGIDLDRPYILFNPSFVDLKFNLIYTLNDELCFIDCFMSILIVHSVRLRRVASWVDLLASENRSMACYHGLCDSASHFTISTVEWGPLSSRSIPDKA